MTVYAEEEVRHSYRMLTEELIRRGLTITTMESATAGQIASLITDTEGSSAVLKGAFITYSNEAKIKQGVSPGIIDRYSVYSRETAQAMARACRRAYQADIGIGVTGTMGNIDPANKEASRPGDLYFAIDTDRETRTFKVQIPPQPNRYMYKLAAALEVYLRLKDILDSWDQKTVADS